MRTNTAAAEAAIASAAPIIPPPDSQVNEVDDSDYEDDELEDVHHTPKVLQP